MPIEDYNPVFDEPTAPRADTAATLRREEKPAASPAVKPDAEHPARPARARQRTEKPAEMSKALRNHWRTTLQNAALKLAADRARLDESEQAWADTVAEARTLGIAANVILAAAAGADVELPE